MQAWQFSEYGRFEDVLEWVERDDPIAGEGEAVIRTTAASLNFPDLLMCQGKYQVKQPLPAVSGAEGVGIVESIGAGSKFQVGQRVVGFCHGGGTLADKFKVANNNAWALPDHVDDATAAALTVTYGTSYFALMHRAQIQPGETLLVLGGAGGVGLAAIQLGKVFGATVIAAAGSPEKLEICRQQGADHVINYRDEDLVERVKDITDGRFADVIYDPVGGEIFEQTKRCIAWEGRIIIIGFAGGSIPKIECNRMLLKNMSVVGLAWGQYLGRNPALAEKCQAHLYDLLRAGAIKPVIFNTLPFDKVFDGMRMLEERGMYGKIIVER
jgi:NADPH:quinone reductase